MVEPVIGLILFLLSLVTVTIHPWKKTDQPPKPPEIQRTVPAPESVDSAVFQQP